MKNIVFTISIFLLIVMSCTLFTGAPKGSIYVLDWEKEAIYVIDSLMNISGPFIVAGAAPTDFVKYENEFFVSNSGFGGIPTIDKYIDGELVEQYVAEEYSSPAGIAVDDNYVYVALWGSGEIIILNRNDLTLEKTIKVNLAYQLLLDNNKLYVGTSGYLENSEYLYIINTENFQKDSIKLGINPCYMDKFDSKIYVSCMGNFFGGINGSIVILENDKMIDSIKLNSCPGNIDFEDGHLFVTNNVNDNQYNFLVFDENLDTLKGFYFDSPADMEAMENNLIIGTNSGKIYVIDIATLSNVDSIDNNFQLKSAKMRYY